MIEPGNRPFVLDTQEETPTYGAPAVLLLTVCALTSSMRRHAFGDAPDASRNLTKAALVVPGAVCPLHPNRAPMAVVADPPRATADMRMLTWHAAQGICGILYCLVTGGAATPTLGLSPRVATGTVLMRRRKRWGMTAPCLVVAFGALAFIVKRPSECPADPVGQLPSPAPCPAGQTPRHRSGVELHRVLCWPLECCNVVQGSGRHRPVPRSTALTRSGAARLYRRSPDVSGHANRSTKTLFSVTPSGHINILSLPDIRIGGRCLHFRRYATLERLSHDRGRALSIHSNSQDPLTIQ